MKASLFFIVLGVTLCTSLWAGGKLAGPYFKRAESAPTANDSLWMLLVALANLFISAAGPITLIVLILNKPHK